MKFYKNSVSCFEKKWFWLTDWLADSGEFINRVFPTGGLGDSPPPAQNLLIPPPVDFPQQIFVTPHQRPICLPPNSNFQVITQSKQHF